MIPKDALSVEYLVRGFDCGYGGPFSPLALANYFQEAAGIDADRLGFGRSAMAQAGRTWMLSRFHMRIDGLPREGDRVRVRTWPSGCERLFALRDIVLEGEGGACLVRAVYAYLVVDFAARKPLRPDRVFEASRLGAAAHALADFSLGAAAPEAPEPVFRQCARPRHIDHNGHVNNAHCVDWLVDAAAGRAGDPAEAGPAPAIDALREFKVDFLREALEGDELEAFAGGLPGSRAGTELRRAGEVVARAELAFAN